MPFLYLIKSTSPLGYDEYDSAVVVANSELEARRIHPGGDVIERPFNPETNSWNEGQFACWEKSPDKVDCVFLGTADGNFEPGSVICSSFNAG